ncbi:DUF3450 domain-containing protein [Robiginitomaculum antarcticum]|uniref:DUF3450 domain-containing protein n=1 Tax=Robiginitomaculum antarcticum TaxID=437507 RepID=UPI00035DFF1E|nr:DUF3450 domain-containing protein [Robiginitomaculum antarcticum]
MLKISYSKSLLIACGTLGLTLAAAAPASAQLEQALSVAKSSTAQSQAAQKTIDNADDSTDSMKREYLAVLQQKDNIELFVKKQDIYLESQAAELRSLQTQLETVEQTKQNMSPMMLRMVVGLEDAVENDLPFRMAERRARISRLKGFLSDPTVSPAEQYRQILNAYKIEVTYGQQLDAYEGAHPSDPSRFVNFVRYGRVAFLYVTKDESEMARFNTASQSWEPITASEAGGVRRAMRVALKESAPEMVVAPVIVGGN